MILEQLKALCNDTRMQMMEWFKDPLRNFPPQEQALDSARESLRLTTNQYKAGLIAYLDVVSVQTTALSTERSVLNLLPACPAWPGARRLGR